MSFHQIAMGAVSLGLVLVVTTGAGLDKIGLGTLGGFGSSVNLMSGPTRSKDNLLSWGLSSATLHHPGVATAAGYVLINQVVARVPDPNDEQVPAEIVDLIADDCRAPMPSPDQAFHAVHASFSRVETGLHPVSHEEIVETAEKWIEQQSDDLTKPRDLPRYYGGKTMGVAEVIVTDTSAPVYLVLQSQSASLIYSIQTAPGVVISDVVVVAQGDVGVANVPDGAQLDLIGPGCDYVMSRMPTEDWDFVRNTRNGIGDQALLDEHVVRAGAYADWFAGMFGQDVEDTTVGYGTQSYVLVGPVPSEDALVVHQPMGTLHLTPSDLLLSGTKQERGAVWTQATENLLIAAIGGPISTLQTIAPMTREDL